MDGVLRLQVECFDELCQRFDDTLTKWRPPTMLTRHPGVIKKRVLYNTIVKLRAENDRLRSIIMKLNS